VIRRLFVLALLVIGALLLAPLRVPTEGVIAPRSLFLFGILLLAAETLGSLAHDLRAPRIVGYLAAGMMLGPSVLGIIPAHVLGDLGMMKRLAVGLIGLLAGMELRLPDLQRRWRVVMSVVGAQLVIVPLLVLLTVVLGRSWFPFAAGLGTGDLILVGLLFGSLLAVNSPMVTLALLTETRAEGPVAKTVLGVVLVADVAVIFLLSFLLGIAQGNLGGDAPSLWAVLFGVVKDVGVSLVAGAVVGGLLTLYLRYVRQQLVLFAVLIVFAAAGAAGALHFELMLSLLVAGFLVENVAPVRAEPLLRALSDIAWPVFVVFFALAGAELPVAAFLSLWPVVVGVAGIRAFGIWLAARVGTRRGRAEPAVASWAWLGLVSQAGVALGLATIVADRLPGVGVAIQLITVGVIAVNETVGPVLFRLALARAQELGPGEVEVVEIAPSPLRPA